MKTACRSKFWRGRLFFKIWDIIKVDKIDN